MTVTLPDGLLAAVNDRLARGLRVRRTLPGGGRLHIDRQLPFLVVYRKPPGRNDRGTRRFVLSQASYLAAPADEEFAADLEELVGAVVHTLSEVFGAFLIVEIWTAPGGNEAGSDSILRVVTPDQQADLDAVDELVEALGDLQLFGWAPDVRHVEGKTAAPPGMPPLIDPVAANRWKCFMIGIELRPVFREADDGLLYPEVTRKLTAQLATALQRTFFAFSRAETSADPKAYQGLGRRAVLRAVRYVDEDLGALCERFDFLLAVTPVNATEAWKAFRQTECAEAPTFQYRPLTTDPELLLRELYEVPLEDIEDPALDRIFREKLREVARQLTMLAERNTHRFIHGSRQLYGEVDDDLLRLAEGLLAMIPDSGPRAERSVDAEDFAQLATREFHAYERQYDEFEAKLDIRDDLSGLMVSKGTLLIDRALALTPLRAHALLHHEVGTHVVTYANGAAQPLRMFRAGLAGYEALQEGLAVLSEYLVGGLTRGRLSLLAARVVAVERMSRGAGFCEIFHELTGVHGLNPHTAFIATMRVVRGGGLTKDALYLRGLQQVIDYLRDGGELETLFIGKISLQHVPIVEELLYRGVLRTPPLRPTCLDEPGTRERIETLRSGIPIVEMFERGT